MLTLQDITLARGSKMLLEQTSLVTYEKQKIGIIGRNGCGKSTFFSLLRQEISPDAGKLQLQPHLRIAYLAQHIPDSEEEALEFVLNGDNLYKQLQNRLQQAEQQEHHEEILACHNLLEETNGYSKPAKAATIMAGLGFSTAKLNNPVNSFSGGWRMRLNLAKCLMQPADLLLLDEPTNHLDIEAIIWLEKWLKQTAASVFVISHDRAFLDKFITHILHFHEKTIQMYSGNYSSFERIRAEQLTLQQKLYKKQQQKVNHLMDFVKRFKAKASKARQAQSRLKMIDKMELIAKAQLDSPFSFQFYSVLQVSNPLVKCTQVAAGYDPHAPILNNIQFQLNHGDRIALLGHNGQGKSTFIKTLTGNITPLQGEIYRSPNLKIGYYAQHQLEELDFMLTPIEIIQNLDPKISEQNVRDYLGGFNFNGEMAATPITHFSGGEKARLALAKLIWQKPNVLLLDEPTNHLDLEMRAALEIALQTYEGAVVLISHDRHLLQSSVDTFYLINDKAIQLLKGDVDVYTNGLTNTAEISSCTPILPVVNSYKDRKVQLNRLKKLEQQLDQTQLQLKKLEEELAGNELYTGDATVLNRLLADQNQCHALLNNLEEEWLTLVATLENH